MNYPPEVERQIRRECKKFKEPLPKPIQNKPDLFFGSALFLNAWFDLDAERERPKPITRRMAFEYAEDYDFSQEQKEDLWDHLRAMEEGFVKWWKNKNRNKDK